MLSNNMMSVIQTQQLLISFNFLLSYLKVLPACLVCIFLLKQADTEEKAGSRAGRDQKLGLLLGSDQDGQIRNENIRGTQQVRCWRVEAREGQIEMVWTCPEKWIYWWKDAEAWIGRQEDSMETRVEIYPCSERQRELSRSERRGQRRRRWEGRVDGGDTRRETEKRFSRVQPTFAPQQLQ